MGLVNFGVPEKEVEFLKKKMNLDVFVEGGAYKGNTAKNMSKVFNKVYTIEKSSVMHDIAKKNLKEIDNVTLLKGDTRKHLNSIINVNNNILFWLDAHWSGGDTYGKGDECPLIEELKNIFSFDKNQVILIDDARCFLAPPPLPHDYKNWPSLGDILRVIPKSWELVVYEDVIYLFPEKISDKFKLVLQKKVTKKHNKKPTFFQRVFKGMVV